LAQNGWCSIVTALHPKTRLSICHGLSPVRLALDRCALTPQEPTVINVMSKFIRLNNVLIPRQDGIPISLVIFYCTCPFTICSAYANESVATTRRKVTTIHIISSLPREISFNGRHQGHKSHLKRSSALLLPPSSGSQTRVQGTNVPWTCYFRKSSGPL
jgi:hypothetical protein